MEISNLVEVQADLFSIPDQEALVNTVNCVGVMGKGIALEFKKRYPYMFLEYCSVCRNRHLAPGGVYAHVISEVDNPQVIYSMATKDHWRQPSKLVWVMSGLNRLAEKLEASTIRSITMPRPGCGNGGLDWKYVRPAVVDFAKRVSFCKVTVVHQ